MSILTPRPITVTQMVRRWIDSKQSEARQYENVLFAIDASGAYDLHELAAAIYAAGFNDGAVSTREQEHSERLVTKHNQEAAPNA